MKTIGYAIVGTGYFGAELGRILNEQEGAKVVAVLDPENARPLPKSTAATWETDLDVLCGRPDVDAVIVATTQLPPQGPVLAAARHKKHVFCEKPMALSYADCDEMVRTAQENGVILMAGHVMNFFHGVRKAKQLIAEGAIGRVLYAHLRPQRLGGAPAGDQLEKGAGPVRRPPVPPHPRGGLHPVHHGPSH